MPNVGLFYFFYFFFFGGGTNSISYLLTLKPKKCGQMGGQFLKIGTFLNFLYISTDKKKFGKNMDTW